MKHRFTLMLIIVMLFAVGCSKKMMFEDADLLLSELEIEKKIGQMMLIAFPGKKMNPSASAIIKKYSPGGLLLFGYNIGNRNELKGLINELQSDSMKNTGLPMFISVDQEGGRVKRISDGVTLFPGNMAAGVSGDEDLVYRWARIVGLQLRTLGVNINLAPAVDVNINPRNPVINTRSFGPDPEMVALLGRAYIEGIQKSRCVASVKHFPGHGDTSKDSHLTLPVVKYGMDRLEKVELLPFYEAIESGVETVMSAHIAFPRLSGNDPATISPFFLKKLLRKKMKFKGLVFTDDLAMKAVSGDMDAGESAVKSVEAGADVVLISSYGKDIELIKNGLIKAVKSGRIKESRIDKSVRRILELKFRYGIMKREKKRIESGSFILSEDEMEILNDAEKVNIELSRKGISFHGDTKLLYPSEKTSRIFISSNRNFNETLRLDSNDMLLTSIDKLSELKKVSEKRVLYYLSESKYLGRISTVVKLCRKRGIVPVIVSSSDPFPLALSGLADNILLTFSSTPESLRQAALCLSGEFKPADLDKFFPAMVKDE